MIVVANRVPVEADKVGNSVSVLTREAIRESQAVLTSDLLATLPGVGVTRNGGPGTATLLRVRGAESDHTLVLIDGVQINDPASPGGGFDFSNLLVGDTDRIEVLRGSQSTLYGSQAIGGVVNIVSTPAGEEPEADLLAEYGSMNSSLMKAGHGRPPRPPFGASRGGLVSHGWHFHVRFRDRGRWLSQHHVLRAPRL